MHAPLNMTAGLPLTDSAWMALSARDAGQDGRFVYAVKTTGVYCRPSCGARTPKRSNVSIYASPAEAAAAGYRACKRCHPDQDRGAVETTVAMVRAHIDARLLANPEQSPTLAELAKIAGWSSAHLQRTFTRSLGLSPRAYADAQRVAQARDALRSGCSVLDATFGGGYGSGKALYQRAAIAFGMTPAQFRRGATGVAIRYALFDTALGVVLVAATTQGVCAVSLGDNADALLDALRADFHAAGIARDDAALGPWAEPILRVLAGAPGTDYTEAARALLALPIEVRGTVFQRRVWAALRDIPVGETRSYTQVAASIGRASAVRAVAQACGANRLSLLVPCHRVIAADGDLRGYRWGPQRKRQLLDMEKAQAATDAPTPQPQGSPP